jgi:hypothetical protein
MTDIQPEQLAEVLAAEFMRYTREISEIAGEVVTEVTAEALNMLKNTGGYENHPEAGKTYRTSFYSKKSTSSSGFVVSSAIGNRQWSLTHLLEFGHVIRSGGRTRAFPHFAPVQAKYVKVFEQRMKARIQRGGG